MSLGLLGKDIEELQGAKKEVMTILKNMSSVRDISDNTSTGKREILLELKPEAYALGFRTSEIIRQIRQGFSEMKFKGYRKVQMRLRYGCVIMRPIDKASYSLKI